MTSCRSCSRASLKQRRGSDYVGLLKQDGKGVCGFVDHVIVSNDLWRETLISRSVSEEKCSVFLNHVDPAVFYRRAANPKR